MKKSVLSLGIILAAIVLTSAAHADICGIVTKSQAENSLAFLTTGTQITQTYAVQPSSTVRTVTVAFSTNMAGVAYYDLKVNGKSIDPGHTNIVINSNVSLNLGRLVGCDASASDPDIIQRIPLASKLK